MGRFRRRAFASWRWVVVGKSEERAGLEVGRELSCAATRSPPQLLGRAPPPDWRYADRVSAACRLRAWALGVCPGKTSRARKGRIGDGAAARPSRLRAASFVPFNDWQ